MTMVLCRVIDLYKFFNISKLVNNFISNGKSNQHRKTAC